MPKGHFAHLFKRADALDAPSQMNSLSKAFPSGEGGLSRRLADDKTDEESAGVVYVCIFLLEMFVPPIYRALHTSPIALLIRLAIG